MAQSHKTCIPGIKKIIYKNLKPCVKKLKVKKNIPVYQSLHLRLPIPEIFLISIFKLCLKISPDMLRLNALIRPFSPGLLHASFLQEAS